jgi:hypothetical protein
MVEYNLETHEKHSSTVVDLTKINPKWFGKTKLDGEVYDELIATNPKEMSVSEQELECQEIGESLVRVMKAISLKLKRKDANCKVCGGLKEEIAIAFDGKSYRFTCYRIDSLKTNKKLKETDYKKFAEYGIPKPKPISK